MASFGAKYPHFSKIKTEPDDALPTYEGPVNIGRLVKADLTVNLASGKLYADDELAESVDEFSSGSVAMETDDMTDDVAAEVYGCTVEEKKVHYKAGDSAPLGGLAYYKVLMRKGVKLFKGYFYPRVRPCSEMITPPPRRTLSRSVRTPRPLRFSVATPMIGELRRSSPPRPRRKPGLRNSSREPSHRAAKADAGGRGFPSPPYFHTLEGIP